MSSITTRAELALAAALLAAGSTPALAAAATHRKQHPGKQHHSKQHHSKRHHGKRHRSHPAGTGASPQTGGQSAVGDFTSGGFQFKFDATRAAGAPQSAAQGSFTGTLPLAGQTLANAAGPVTCLDVVGTRVGLFYPITSSSPAILAALKGVFISAQLGRDGKPQSLTFEPLFTSTMSSCPPTLGLLPISSGTLTLTS